MTGRGPKREGDAAQPREVPGAIAENIIAETARMLASQANNVAQLWLKLPAERRTEVLGQLEREAAARNLKTALKADPGGLSSSDTIFPPVPDQTPSPETDPDKKN
ncbi:MAG: hypothetical protein HGA47_00065 [Zoogloea sp.]|nr:hypothetical protein [Zoogloea sp.]